MAWTYHNKPPMGWPLDLSEPINDGLAGYWYMPEGSGTTVQDLSENGYNLSLVDGTFWTAGKFSPVLQFDGTDDAAKNTVPIITGPPFTVVSLFKLDTTTAVDGQGQTVWGHASANTPPNMDWWRLRIRDSDDLFQYGSRVDGGGAANALSTVAAVANRWYQTACVEVSAAERHLHVDGILVGSDTTSIAPSDVSNHFFQLGRNPAGSGGGQNELDGAIGTTMLYNRVLSASEIALLSRFPFYGFMNPDEIPVLDQYYTVAVGANPKGPLGHPLYGALAGPISF